ncbi:MAG: YidC/Oxa1 family membrane protein insertase [Actinomycetota bacterium]|nr:YidC/Oxa1 family membrane protein insertase [Actinomycetota bacterium]
MIVANILQPLIDLAETVILFFHDDVGFSWGWAIVALTFATRLVILPLSVSQIRSMRALQAYSPQIKAIQERYKDDKQRQQREMIAFYQENKINPFASCIPLLLQLPVFLALYQLLNGDDFQADMLSDPPVDFFFINDLTEKATGGPLVALIILFIITQMGASAVMASRADKNQRIIMFVLPFVFAPFVITFPAGLAVYWISTNIWTLGQQTVVRLFFPPPEIPTVEAVKAATPPPPPPRKKKKRR